MPGQRSPRLSRLLNFMAYITSTDLAAYIADNDLIPASDDTGAGSQNNPKLTSIIATAQMQVDGRLASIYTVPISPVPTLCKIATVIFTCEALYARRLTPDQVNPFKSQADQMRKRLDLIGMGEVPLDATVTRSFTPGAIIGNSVVFNTTTA